MNDYILFMHDDAPSKNEDADGASWERYFAKLRSSGRFSGGSSIGNGACFVKAGMAKKPTSHLVGYIRVQATDMDDAKTFLEGNPVFEAGGTVEIRELPRE